MTWKTPVGARFHTPGGQLRPGDQGVAFQARVTLVSPGSLCIFYNERHICQGPAGGDRPAGGQPWSSWILKGCHRGWWALGPRGQGPGDAGRGLGVLVPAWPRGPPAPACPSTRTGRDNLPLAQGSGKAREEVGKGPQASIGHSTQAAGPDSPACPQPQLPAEGRGGPHLPTSIPPTHPALSSAK